MIIVTVDSTALPLRKLQSTNLGRDRFSRTDLQQAEISLGNESVNKLAPLICYKSLNAF